LLFIVLSLGLEACPLFFPPVAEHSNFGSSLMNLIEGMKEKLQVGSFQGIGQWDFGHRKKPCALATMGQE
jgi:hypothetical protein